MSAQEQNLLKKNNKIHQFLSFAKRPVVALCFIVLFIVSAIQVVRYSSYKYELVTRSYETLVTKAEEIQTRLYKSHLHLEKYLVNENEYFENDAGYLLTEIKNEINCINQYQDELGGSVSELTSKHFYKHLNQLDIRIDTLLNLSGQRIKQISDDVYNNSIALSYEQLFIRLIDEADEIRKISEELLAENINSFNQIQNTINYLLIFVLLLTVFLFYFFDKNNSENLSKLRDINNRVNEENKLRIEIENSLEDANRMLTEERNMFVSGPIVIFKFKNDKEWPIEYLTSNMYKLSGYQADDFVNGRINYVEIIHADDRERVVQQLITSLESDMVHYKIEPYKIMTSDGGIRWVEEFAKIIRDENNKATYVLGYIYDVTKRITTELELSNHDEIQNAILQSTDDGILVVDNDGKVVTKNDTFFTIWNIPDTFMNENDDDQLLRFALSKLVNPDQFLKKVRELYNSHESSYDELEFIDGRIIERYSYPLFFKGNLNGRVWNFRDITEKTQAIRELKESEELYRDMFEKNTAMKLYIDPDNGLIVNANKAACDFYGYDLEKIQTLKISDINILSKEEIQKEMDYARKHDKTSFAFQHRLASGEIRDVEVHSGPIVHKNKTLLFSIVFDVTERKKAERQLKENEEQVRFLLENILVGVAITTEDAKVLTVNKRFSDVTGYKFDEIKDNIAHIYANSDDRKKLLTQIRRFGQVENFEVKFKKKNGEIIWVSMSTRKVTYQETTAMLTIFIDITETKKLKEQHARAEKLETAGKIAGQIAHDFNNLLAPLMAYPDFIRDELSEEHPALTYIDDIERSAMLISEINQQLLTLGRRGHYNQEPLNINTIIKQIINDVKIESDSISYNLNLSEDLMNIIGGSSQLYRVFANLIYNAKDAITDSGQISVKTDNYYVDDMSMSFYKVPKGEYVKVTISDNGCGIPKKIINKIFDPFYTTKSTDKKRGSGLGLSVVNSVVKDHHGYIDIESKVGIGTSIYIYFPITRDSISNEQLHQIQGGNEKILIVDDDSIQRSVTTKILEKLGYQVSVCSCGEDAVDFVKTNPQDLILLDMVMPPGIDGTETFKRITEIYPNQKAMIVSGFSETKQVIEAQRLGCGTFVKKPFTCEAIAHAIRFELDKKETVPV